MAGAIAPVHEIGPQGQAVRAHEKGQPAADSAVAASDEVAGADVKDVSFRLAAVANLVAVSRERVDLEVRILLVKIFPSSLRQRADEPRVRPSPAGEGSGQVLVHQAAKNRVLVVAADPRFRWSLHAVATADQAAVAD